MEVFDPASTREELSIRLVSSLCNLGTDRVENTASKNFSIFARLFVGAETYLSSRYQAVL
jgi:hypothetical protein